MKSNYRPLGEIIYRVDERNSDGQINNLIGVSIDKCFIKSVANTIGTDLSKYKVIRRNQFAVSLMQVSRDAKIPIACLDEDVAIMSPAYSIFAVKNENEVLPAYLNLWFQRSEFDREAAYIAVGGVRGSMPWDDFCRIEGHVPGIEEQRHIVEQYNVINKRIELKKKINDNLEAQSQALLTGIITANETISTSLGDIVDFIDGDRGKYYPTFDEFSDMGYCLFLNASNVTSTGFSFDTCQFVTKEKDELLRKGHLSRGDIVLTSRGTLGNVAFYNNYIPFDNVRINSGMLIIRPKTDRYSPVFLYTLLKSGYMKAAIESLKSGSAQPQLPIKDLQKAQFEIPTDDGGLLQLSDKLSCLDNAYSENCLEIMALKNMSSLILSELSSR